MIHAWNRRTSDTFDVNSRMHNKSKSCIVEVDKNNNEQQRTGALYVVLDCRQSYSSESVRRWDSVTPDDLSADLADKTEDPSHCFLYSKHPYIVPLRLK